MERVGVLDRLRNVWRLSSPLDLGIKSPWTEGDLSQILLSEMLGEDVVDALPISRSSAIAIPAVSKARNLLVATIGRFPLYALGDKWRPIEDGEERTLSPHLIDDRGMTQVLREQPAWLSRTDGPVSPYERMVWTVDSLIFDGITIWEITKQGAERDGRKPILDAEWVPPEHWTITNGNVLIDEKQVPEDRYILFNSPFEGLLNVGNTTLRGARDLEQAWTARMRNPIQITEMVVDANSQLEQSEVDEMAAKWLKKHKAGEPSFGVSTGGAHLETHGGEFGDKDLFIESRNAIRTDVGSFLNVRASMLDGTAGIDSLTYSTTEGEKNAFYEFDLPFWTDPIEQALSIDRVVPRGQRVRFDKYEGYHLPTPTGAPTKD